MEISRISPDSGAVGTRVSIYSNSIAPEHAKNQVEINGMPVPILSFASNKLVVEVPEGMSSGPVTLQVNGKVANGPYFKLLTDGPEIDGVTPGRGGPGTQITLTGDYFLPPSMMAKISGDTTARGAVVGGDSLQADTAEVTLKAKGEPTPNINGLPVSVAFGDQLAPLLSLSNTEIIVEVPEEATSSTITLIVGERAVTSEAFRLLPRPVITEVVPTAGSAGTQVTITGHHFASHPGSNQVRFNGIRARITEADTARLVVTVPDEATTGPIQITRDGHTTTGLTFTVSEAPVPQVTISDLSPKEGPVGTSVTITGINFSATKTENTVTFNGTKATVSSASETRLTVTAPEGATSGPVKVTAGNQTATGPSFTVTEEPVPQVSISDISPKTGPTGTSVTIAGQNFGPTAAENTVRFNGTVAAITSASTTELVAAVPQDATSGPVKVSVGSQAATGPSFTVTEASVPQVEISTINPKYGPVGAQVTITGQNFSSSKVGNTVTFNGTKAPVETASSTQLTVTVPADATDGPVKVTVGGQTVTGPSFTVAVNEAPTITGEAFFNVDENTTDVATITASDPDGDELTFSMSGGDDQGQFSIDGNSGKLTFTTAPDFDNPGDANGDNSYKAEVKVSDGVLIVTKIITAAVANVNEVPAITSDASFTVVENSTAVGTIVATDPEGDNLTFSLAGGADADAFTINANSGELALNTVPDVENPADGNGDNVYEVQIAASDGSRAATQNLTVSVMNVNEAPAITSNSSFGVDENTTAIGTVSATDPEGDALTYSISGGEDQVLFNIDPNSGKLVFTAPPDFEHPADANHDNTYQAQVQVTDGQETATQSLTVTLQDVVGDPSYSAGQIYVDEFPYNPIFIIDGTFSFVYDRPIPDGTDLSPANDPMFDFSLTFDTPNMAASGQSVILSGPDQDSFTITNVNYGSLTALQLEFTGGNNGVVEYNNPHDANGDHKYVFTIIVDDGTHNPPSRQTFILPVAP